jgi:hypothetical protein
MTVTGMSRSSSLQTWLMPNLRPSIVVAIRRYLFLHAVVGLSAPPGTAPRGPLHSTFSAPAAHESGVRIGHDVSLELDLDIDAGRKLQPHE